MFKTLCMLAWSIFFSSCDYSLAGAQTYPVFYNGQQITAICSKNKTFCSFYIAAILSYRYDAGIDSIANGKNNSAEACIPEGDKLDDIVPHIITYIQLHPRLQKDASGVDLVQQAISYSFPC